jgi:hypothetical protein
MMIACVNQLIALGMERRGPGGMAFTLAWLLATLCASSPGIAATKACANTEVQVIGAAADDHQDVCAGAQAALDFLGLRGARPNGAVVIEVTSAVPQEAGPTAVGCYIAERKRVYMLPYADFRRRKTWFGVPIDRRLYRSVAAHEAAHAVAGCNFTMPRPSIQAQEYVAYVVTFATMEPSLRARALRALPGSGFASEDRITAISYMFDPMRFGAEAWRHYLKPDQGDAFIQSVLTGRALLD